MNDISVIDRFLDVFLRYIDSGFGLLHGEVAFLTATLVVIDMTLAGLFWAMGGDDVVGRLIKKTLYVGAFAFLIGNFAALANIVFRSFAGLGLTASGAAISQAQFLQPGQLARVGVEAARPLMTQIGTLAGFPEVLASIDTIVVLGISWLVVIVSFFVLAVQLFVTLIEFKLTTLAGFVLVPFALWSKTAFLAERVLGNVVSSGIKVLVLAVIVGIGSGLFAEFQVPEGTPPSIDLALVIMLASLAMLGLGIFGPGIATGLVSGAPQLGAGAAAGATLGAGGMVVAGGVAVASAGAAVSAGARMAPGALRSSMSGAAAAYRPGAARAGGGFPVAGAGPSDAVRTAGMASGARVAEAVRGRHESSGQGRPSEPGVPSSSAAPGWAIQMQRGQRLLHGATSAVQTLRAGDHGGSGASPSLRDDSNS